MKLPRLLVAAALSLLVGACANMANAIGAGYLTLDTLADTAYAECANPTPQDPCAETSLLTTQQARDIGDELQRAKDALDDANRAYDAGEAALAGDKLELANAVLQSVKATLTARGIE